MMYETAHSAVNEGGRFLQGDPVSTIRYRSRRSFEVIYVPREDGFLVDESSRADDRISGERL